MSDDDAGDLVLDLSNWDGIVPDSWAAEVDERQEQGDNDEGPEDGESMVEESDLLPTGFEDWNDDQRESWAWDSDLSLHDSRARRRLYSAWMTLHPEADPLRRDRERGVDRSRPVFADVAAILDGGLRPPSPDGGPTRTDGARVLYRGKVNALVGDPESAKTLFALVTLADELICGGVGVFIDTDHNGAEFVLRFLLVIGVSREALVERFRYAEPEDRDELLSVIEAVAELDSCAVVLDSVGENLTIWGVSANDDQGVIELNRATAARLAKIGHLVVTIDHLAKNSDSRKYGATGSTAKKRAVNGVMFEVVVVDEFSPDDGGKSALILRKDRSGGVRALGYKAGDTVALFEVTAPDPTTQTQTWILHPGTPVTAATTALTKAAKLAADVAALTGLTPPPRSKMT